MFDESEYPKYLRPEVTAELKRRSVQCYPSLAPLFCPENPHAAFAYVDSSRLEHGVCGIEMPLETPLDEFTANVAVLHEIGHIVSEQKKIPRSVWRKEIAAWKCAEKIRDSIGFPQGDPRTGNTWDEAKRFALSTLRATQNPLCHRCAAVHSQFYCGRCGNISASQPCVQSGISCVWTSGHYSTGLDAGILALLRHCSNRSRPIHSCCIPSGLANL